MRTNPSLSQADGLFASGDHERAVGMEQYDVIITARITNHRFDRVKLIPCVNQVMPLTGGRGGSGSQQSRKQPVPNDGMAKVLVILLTAMLVIPLTAEAAVGIGVNRMEVQTGSHRIGRSESGPVTGKNTSTTATGSNQNGDLIASSPPAASADRVTRNISPGHRPMCPDWAHRTGDGVQSDELGSGDRTTAAIGSESQHIPCSCYEFEEGVFIECPNTDLRSVTTALASLSQQSVKSFTIYNLDPGVRELPSAVFPNSTRIERLRISDSLIELLADEALTGIAAGLRTLALSNSKLKSIPQKPLSTLKSLESLDLDLNQIQEIGSYSFYGLPLTSLSLQSNRISTLFEYTFGGLENTLQELTLIHNELESVPLIALRRLKNLRTLKLNENSISQIPYDGFTKFLQLQNLDLRSNRILYLDESSFKSMPKLASLSLSSNKLTRIEDKVFKHLADLESLDLSKNSLRVLNGAVFASLNKLRSIDLSYNHLHFVEMGTFHSLPNLRELFLTRNNLMKLLNGTFYNSTQMRSLFLEHNSIEAIESGVFSSLSHLYQLHLSFNQITSLDAHLFKFNSELRSLSLDNNLIEIMKPGVFDDLLELRDLRLQKNVIRKISRGNFNLIPNLQELHLQYNVINSIEVDSFKTLVNLEYLNLQGNQIDSMIHQIFNKFPTNLKHLTMSHNTVNRVNEKAFDGQAHLEILSLDHNRLTKVTCQTFNNLTSLEKLYLDHNEITWIEPSSFSSFQNLIHLNLANNRLNRLQSKTFQGVVSLMSLDLSFNPITVIEAGAFSPLLRSLRSLELEKSEIRVIRRDFFADHISSDTSHRVTAVPERGEEGGGGRGGGGEIDRYAMMPVLETLKLSSCKIEKIEPRALSCLTSLRTLDLRSNRLQRGSLLQSARESAASDQKANHKSSFASASTSSGGTKEAIFPPDLVSLFLSGNNLSGLDLIPDPGGGDGEEEGVNIFQDLNKIELLDLSHTGIQSGSFFTKALNRMQERQQFRHLHTLKLIGNGIQFIPSSSSTASLPHESGGAGNHSLLIESDIRELFLDQNMLNSSPGPDVLKLMPSLEHLSLSGNNIKRIPGGSFRLNNRISQIDLSNNSLSVIDAASFRGLNMSLQSINLSNNVMRSISAGVFDGLNKLQEINFDNNWFQFIPNNLLKVKSLSSVLKSLSFNSNPMTKIRDDLSLNDLTLESLEKLSLEAGNVTVIASQDFVAFPGLRELTLRQNYIAKISPGSFQPLHQLLSLDLSANDLQILPEERLSSLSNLRTLNLSRNHLADTPSFSPHLKSLASIDLSFNRLTKIESFGHVGESMEELLLHDNMIAWLAGNSLQNLTSLKKLDIRNNFLTHVTETLFTPIEVSLEVLLISGNPFHCDCRLLSLWEWTQEHPRITPSRERDTELVCRQTDGERDILITSLHPVDFCPMPLISRIDVNQILSNQLTLKWEVRNESLVGGFNVDQYLAGEHIEMGSQRLPPTDRSVVIQKLKPETSYMLCVEAKGRYLRTANQADASGLQRSYDDNFVTPNRKCIQAKTQTEASSKQMIIFFQNISLTTVVILASAMTCMMLTVLLITGLTIKWRNGRRRRRVKQQEQELHDTTGIPEEYITYRHFSPLFGENVYS